MDDINEFFAEQEQHMNLPDEDVHEYIRARLQDRHKQRMIGSSSVIRAQSHGLEDRCTTAASWPNSGPFRASTAESVPPKPDTSEEENVSKQLKRKSAEPRLSPQRKKQKHHDTSQVSVLPPAFSRSKDIEYTSNYPGSTKLQLNMSANPTSQHADHGKLSDTQFETTSSPDQAINNPSVTRSQRKSPNKHPHANDVPKSAVTQSRSHITNPVVNCEKSKPNASHSLPPITPTRKSEVSKSVAQDAIRDQEPTNDNKSKVYISRLEHDEEASVKDNRLSLAREVDSYFNLLEHPTADTSNITSPSSSPIRCPRSSPRPTIVKPSRARKTVNSPRSKTGISIQNKGRKAKGKPALVTPLEYAQKLQQNFESGKKRKSDYLKGKRILYVGGDMQYASAKTRGRMDYIVKHGGTLIPSYDPTIVTHIVTDATTRPTLRALGLTSLKSIPNHIPTVRWSWVISGYGRHSKRGEVTNTTKGKSKAIDGDGDDESYLDFEFLHAAFPERIDAGRSWLKKGKGKEIPPEGQTGTSATEHDGDFSRISSFTEHPTENQRGPKPALVVLSPAPLNLLPTDNEASTTAVHAANRSSSSRKPPTKVEDPLAEFYEIAKAERDEAGLEQSELDESDDGEDNPEYPIQVPRRGFTCDRKEPQQRECVNQDIIDKLEELMELHKAKLGEEDRWRVYSYSKCIRALRNYPKKIKSFNEARSINGVGEKTAQKIMEIIETGNLRRISYEKTEDVAAINLFQGIYGVGRQISCMWYNNGCRTLDDIRSRKGGIKLSTVQEIGLRFYDDINSRMPRSEAETIFNMIKPVVLELDEHIFVEIMGSFRRGKATCGDIDILITRPTSDGMTHAGLLPELLARLHARRILTEDLALPDDFSALELCYRGLCKLPEPDAKRRRIDILCVPWENRGGALLYYTGDDIFNRAMRMKANVLGYSLNQRGLYAGVVRDPRNRRTKLSEGNIVASETEEEIFKILGVPWQEPYERVRG